MHSLRLDEALTEFVQDAALRLQADVAQGAEVPFELDSQSMRRGRSAARVAQPRFYSYRALTGEFIAERQRALEDLASYAPAASALAGFEGLERYLTAAGVEPAGARGDSRAGAALRALLREVFAEQSDFELNPERMRAALERLEQATVAGPAGVTVVATLHGLMTSSPEVPLAKGLLIAHPEALEGLPDGARERPGEAPDHLVAVLSSEDEDPARAIAQARDLLKDLLRPLRLFGDGRVALGSLAWARVAGGAAWNPMPLGSGGRPHGMLLVTAEQEDELRAFCNLISRRAPEGNELAWALRRFELGCERGDPYEALSDHLLGLRALLEPEGPASGLLPGRLAALCALPEQRAALIEQTIAATELERAVMSGAAVRHAGGEALARRIGDHLRALLRDVICGHLDGDLVGLADSILIEDHRAREADAEEQRSAEQMLGDLCEPEEILDLFI